MKTATEKVTEVRRFIEAISASRDVNRKALEAIAEARHNRAITKARRAATR